MLVGARSYEVTRTAGDLDPYEVDDLDATFAVTATLSSPTGADRMIGGRQESIDAALVAAPAPVLLMGDRVSDGCECWVVAWVQRRTGLGLDHQRCGLRRTTGASNG